MNEILINHLMKQLLSLALGAALWAVAMPSSLAASSGIEDPCSDDCQLVWTQTLSDSSVECIEDVPTTCDEYLAYAEAQGLAAVNACTSQEVPLSVCFPLASGSEAVDIRICEATTAKRDASLEEGEYDANDGAIRLYGLSAMGMADSDYFVEDPSNPLSFEYAADSRSARLTGTVHCVLNPNQIFHVDARFVNEENAADWLAEDPNHALLIADDPSQGGFQMCDVDTSSISVFDMQVLSRLTGAGDYEGTLFLDHMPVSYSKRFQLGLGANNHNCNQGFGGWFRWDGELNGEEVSGLSGDIVVDLACTENDAQCDEYAEFIFEAIDECGRILSQTVTVEREDVTAPTILDGPADMIVECDNVPAMEGPESISATDNCAGDLDISEGVEIRYDGDCPQSYVLDRRWTVIDACGNSSVHVQLVTVQDTMAPALTIPADYTAECSDELVFAEASTVDNCGAVDLQEEENVMEGDCAGNYTITRTFTATDECGNSATATQTITVQDTTAPVLTIPADYTVECSDDITYDDASATDNCGMVEIAEVQEIIAGDCAGNYTISRAFTATDECGNMTSATQTITVQDTTAPEFTFVPVDYTVECSDDMPMEEATATDNCGPVSMEVGVVTTPGACAGEYTITRTFTASDDCGNSASATQTITVQDTTAPELSIPEDYTAECSDELELADAMATDNCGEVDITLSEATSPGVCAQAYTLVRTFTATDECGNFTTASQTITVVDTTAPEFNEALPMDATVECDAVPAAAVLTATDNCQDVSVSFSESREDGDCDANYTLTRTWSVSDDCGNATSHTQIVNVQDTTAPEFIEALPLDAVVDCDSVPSPVVLTAMDNCQDVSVLFAESREDGDCEANYTLTRTWTVADDCGNASMHTQIVTVQDVAAPEFTSIPASYSLECTDEVTYESAEAMDNCSEFTMDLAIDTMFSDCDNVYDIVRTWTATDECGNASEASQTISIVDTTAPQLLSTCGLMNNEIIEVCCEALNGAVTVPAACDILVQDNCGQEATVELVETYNGEFAPTEDVDRWCVISQPMAMSSGETCDGYDPRGVHLFNFPRGEFYNTLNGTVAHHVDGTMTYTMEVASAYNPEGGYTIVAEFTAPMSWDEWMAQPGAHSYKSDCGLGDHTTWEYAMMTSGEATGWGLYEGDSFAMMHQPASGYFGFQMGEGANNKNANYGFSGWFYLSGVVDGQPINASGDLFGDLDCCQSWTLERAYTVTDCAGNASTFAYEVHATGMGCDAEEESGISEGEDTPLVSPKDLIQVLNLQPNPSNALTNLQLLSEEVTTKVTVRLMDASGQEVMFIHEGTIWAGLSQNVVIDVSGLEGGMYHLQITAKNFATVKKLLVVH